jgi:hypothetical protein
MPYVNVDVDVQLDDFDTDDLIKELTMRGKPVAHLENGDDADESLDKIFYAFYFGKESQAVELMRKYVQDVTGRTLP